ncbi:hypothetical protein AB4851_23090 [Burkholderia sp. 22PA0099]|uniref:hypothetical protein n=1 Tax=unclassified Burkholderia TaxID=2613784 RepID=UPI0039C002B7
MNKPATTPALSVLLAYAALNESDQTFFHCKLNEFVFASPSSRRELICRWQHLLAGQAPEASPDD